MKRFLILVAVAALSLGALGTASAHDDQNQRKAAKATLGGFSEIPAISTAGRGQLRLTIDPTNTTITYELSYSGLEGGAVTGAHLHLGQPGVSGGVITDLCGGTKPACPASPTTAAITGTITTASILGPTAQGITPGADFAEVLRAIRAGMVYVNVHTTAFATGEIRGQVKGGLGN
jgi:hypothetical protein